MVPTSCTWRRLPEKGDELSISVRQQASTKWNQSDVRAIAHGIRTYVDLPGLDHMAVGITQQSLSRRLQCLSHHHQGGGWPGGLPEPHQLGWMIASVLRVCKELEYPI